MWEWRKVEGDKRFNPIKHTAKEIEKSIWNDLMDDWNHRWISSGNKGFPQAIKGEIYSLHKDESAVWVVIFVKTEGNTLEGHKKKLHFLGSSHRGSYFLVWVEQKLDSHLSHWGLIVPSLLMPWISPQRMRDRPYHSMWLSHDSPVLCFMVGWFKKK